MSRSRPPLHHRDTTEALKYRPVKRPLYEERNPEDRYRGPFVTAFSGQDARKLKATLTGRQQAVLDALLAIWKHGERDIETSISQIKAELETASVSIGSQHISTILSDLQNRNILRKIESGHNRLILRINPFLYWKSSAKLHNQALAEEREMWSSIVAVRSSEIGLVDP